MVVLLTSIIAVFTEIENHTLRWWKLARIAQAEIGESFYVKEISIFNAPKQINSTCSDAYISNFMRSKSASIPQCFGCSSASTKTIEKGLLQRGHNQSVFIDGLNYFDLSPANNSGCWSLSCISPNQYYPWFIGMSRVLWRQHHSFAKKDVFRENICTQLSSRCSYLEISKPGQTASNNREQNSGKCSNSAPIVVGEIGGTKRINQECIWMRRESSGCFMFSVLGNWVLALVIYAITKCRR